MKEVVEVRTYRPTTVRVEGWGGHVWVYQDQCDEEGVEYSIDEIKELRRALKRAIKKAKENENG